MDCLSYQTEPIIALDRPQDFVTGLRYFSELELLLLVHEQNQVTFLDLQLGKDTKLHF